MSLHFALLIEHLPHLQGKADFSGDFWAAVLIGDEVRMSDHPPRSNQPGLRASQPGFRASQSGLTASQASRPASKPAKKGKYYVTIFSLVPVSGPLPCRVWIFSVHLCVLWLLVPFVHPPSGPSSQA